MEGNRKVTLVSPDDPPVSIETWAVRSDRGGSERVQAETQVGNWAIRWRVRQIGLGGLDHTWRLTDEFGQEHDLEIAQGYQPEVLGFVHDCQNLELA